MSDSSFYKLGSQKQIERDHLHSFRALRSDDFPIGELIESETPDFIVTTDAGRRIGIEHTEVFKQDGTEPTAEQIDEAAKNYITTAASKYAEEVLRLPPAGVTLFFNPQYLRKTIGNKRRSLNKNERDTVAERLAAFIGKNMPEPGHSAHCLYRLDNGQPRQVDELLIHREVPTDRPNWRWMEMNAIQEEAIDRLQGAITRKNKVYEACRRACDECWLLIVAHSFLSSGTIHPDEDSLNFIYDSSFDRTYFLDLGQAQATQLVTSSDTF
jgi:hypothetical protein